MYMALGSMKRRESNLILFLIKGNGKRDNGMDMVIYKKYLLFKIPKSQFQYQRDFSTKAFCNARKIVPKLN